jgi:hypothetical protein
MTPSLKRCSDHVPALLIVSAFGFWLFVVGTFVAGLPDRVASPDQPERVAWAAD